MQALFAGHIGYYNPQETDSQEVSVLIEACYDKRHKPGSNRIELPSPLFALPTTTDTLEHDLDRFRTYLYQ